MSDRIELEPIAVESLIRHAHLEDLRHETPEDDRERSLGQAATALDALCGISDRDGPDAVWDVLAELDRRQLLTFATFAIAEMAEKTDYRSKPQEPVIDEEALDGDPGPV